MSGVFSPWHNFNDSFVIYLQNYRDKIDMLEKTEDEKALLKNENHRLRDEMQGR